MPTNQNAYNSRVTSESLEKKFRDTFTSQGGAELVDDLYASGVVVPVVDFTAAAEGSALRVDLQTATDYATEFVEEIQGNTNQFLSTPGFYNLDIISTITTSSNSSFVTITLSDGVTPKEIYKTRGFGAGTTDGEVVLEANKVVYLRSGDSLTVTTGANVCRAIIFYRQIADVSGNLVNPLGFVSS